VELNPQPFPPGASVALNPQPFPPGPSSSKAPGPTGDPESQVALNPQPFPPGPEGAWGDFPSEIMSYSSGNSSGYLFEGPAESIELVFKTVKIGYKPQKPGDFEIEDFSFDTENPSTTGSAASGAGSGKSEFGEFTIKGRSAGSASPSAPCLWCPR
jgi:hypothetical protein